jgi:NADH:ubiquinone oxidoreductase subunit 4 (subunit M)
MLVMYSAQIGVFAAQDLLLFFLMWELELVPVYLLIAIWGGQKRLYAATKFILYTAAGSVFILVAALSYGILMAIPLPLICNSWHTSITPSPWNCWYIQAS